MSADLSLILTAHDETVVCGPTMRAADLAVEAARARGFTVQVTIGLDAPTEATSTYFNQSHFDHWERRVLHERDLGRLRNALVAECQGRYIAFLDANDLVSENWLAEGVAALDETAERGERAIAHPELNVVFDGQKTVSLNLNQHSRLFTPHYLYFRDFYNSSGLAPREAHLVTPYAPQGAADDPLDPDVRFTIESIARGWRHVVVPDTIIFTRRRATAPGTDSTNRAALERVTPEMAIDRIRDLGSTRT